MWIFDSYFKGCVELWSRERALARASAAYPPSFYLLLKDPPEHREMIEFLETRFKAEDCSFRTIYGTHQGHRIYAGSQSRREDRDPDSPPGRALQRGCPPGSALHGRAEHDLFPYGDRDKSRFTPDFQIPLTILELQVIGDPSMPSEISRIEVLDGHKRKLQGPEQTVLSDLLKRIKSHDPDLILCPDADT